MWKQQVLHLYRDCLKWAHTFPAVKHRSKLIFNVRDLFALRQHEKDFLVAYSHLQHGRSHLELLKKFSTELDILVLQKLFNEETRFFSSSTSIRKSSTEELETKQTCKPSEINEKTTTQKSMQ